MKRKILKVVLVSFLFLTCMSYSLVSATSVKKIKLNKKSITLRVGKKSTLKIVTKSKVKWKTSNRKVVVISTKGVVKAKRAGQAKITAYRGSKKATCNIVVTTDNKDSNTLKSYPITKVNKMLSGSSIQYDVKELGFVLGNESPYAILLKSFDDLKALSKNNVSVKQIIGEYNEMFFQQKSLVFLALPTTNPAYKYTLDSIVKNTNELSIKVKNALGESMLSMPVTWQFFLETNKADLQNTNKFLLCVSKDGEQLVDTIKTTPTPYESNKPKPTDSEMLFSETTIEPNTKAYSITEVDEILSGSSIQYDVKELGFTLGSESPYAILLKSFDDLKALSENNVSVKQIIGEYNEMFFQQKSLVFLALPTVNPAYKYTLDSIVKNTDELNIKVKNVLGESMLTMPVTWQFFLETDKADLQNTNKFLLCVSKDSEQLVDAITPTPYESNKPKPTDSEMLFSETTIEPNIKAYSITEVDEILSGSSIQYDVKELGFALGNESPYAILLKSFDDLKALSENNIFVKQIIGEYNEMFFQQKSLVFLVLPTANPAYKYTLDSIVKNTDELGIKVKNTLGESMITMPVTWQFFLETNKVDLQNINEFLLYKSNCK